jgi:lipopolysaccharide/colanic/teichoic acid biosynthesis glycosyltransferase
VFSVVFLPIALVSKLTSSGPVLFKQERVGYGLRKFTLYKFRTMTNGAKNLQHQHHLKNLIKNSTDQPNQAAPMVKLERDSQITSFGRLLRKTYLDEFPQVINVFCGDMSLVGPRPAIEYEVIHYQNWCKARFDVIPGMTGLWQVSGKNKLSFNEMVRLDISYAKQLRFGLDLKILFLTPLAIAREIRHWLAGEEAIWKRVWKGAVDDG